MSWARFDDNWLADPVVMAMGLQARALFVAGILHCAKGLTDGVIDAAAVPKLGVMADVDDVPKAIATLVDLKAWGRVAGGYCMPDWQTYIRSREVVENERAARAEAGRRGGRPKANSKANGKANSKHGAAGAPKPLPGPTRPGPGHTGTRPLAPKGARGTRETRASEPPGPDKYLEVIHLLGTEHGITEIDGDSAQNRRTVNASERQADHIAQAYSDLIAGDWIPEYNMAARERSLHSVVICMGDWDKQMLDQAVMEHHLRNGVAS